MTSIQLYPCKCGMDDPEFPHGSRRPHHCSRCHIIMRGHVFVWGSRNCTQCTSSKLCGHDTLHSHSNQTTPRVKVQRRQDLTQQGLMEALVSSVLKAMPATNRATSSQGPLVLDPDLLSPVKALQENMRLFRLQTL